MYVAGIDVGSVAAKAVVLEVQPHLAQVGPRVAGRAVLPTGWNTAEAGELALEKSLCAGGDRAPAAATGNGHGLWPYCPAICRQGRYGNQLPRTRRGASFCPSRACT